MQSRYSQPDLRKFQSLLPVSTHRRPGRSKRGGLTSLSINSLRASPTPTEINICNDTLVPEMRPNITIRAGKVRGCFAPRTRVGTTACDVARDSTAGKLPHPDTSTAQLHGHDSTAIIIERRSKC